MSRSRKELLADLWKEVELLSGANDKLDLISLQDTEVTVENTAAFVPYEALYRIFLLLRESVLLLEGEGKIPELEALPTPWYRKGDVVLASNKKTVFRIHSDNKSAVEFILLAVNTVAA